MVRDLLAFLWHRKAIWLVPLFLGLALVGALLVTGEATVLAPFLYPLF